MSNSPKLAKKISIKPKRANGRGSIYQITKPNGRKVWKAAIRDVNGKLRTKNFTNFAAAETFRQHLENQTLIQDLYSPNKLRTLEK